MHSFVFESPNWMLNILCVALCQFVPIVGFIVLLGYLLSVIEQLHLRPTQVYPDFDFNKLGDYLKQGVWPFLIYLIVSVAFAPIVMVLIYGPIVMIIVAAAGSEEMAAVVAAIVIPLFILLFFVAVLLLALVFMPMFLRSGLMQDLPAGFHFGFVRDFIRRVWLEMLLGELFLLVTSCILLPLGYAFFCVGVYAAAAVLFMAHGHLTFQIYQLYLLRGGEQIPLASAVPPVRPGMPRGGASM
jgi:hypothetical protein